MTLVKEVETKFIKEFFEEYVRNEKYKEGLVAPANEDLGNLFSKDILESDRVSLEDLIGKLK